MKPSLLSIIRCPQCASKFSLENPVEKNGEIASGTLRCGQKHEFPITRYVPRLVPATNYSSSWGKLWSETDSFIRDSQTGLPFYYNVVHGKYSEENTGDFSFNVFGFEWPKSMAGEKILEVGPGTGVCTEHLVNTGAEVLSIDMSEAIDVFPEELLIKPNLNVVQADINTPCVPNDFFDRIWLFQVLQHTPSPPETLRRLNDLLKHGGQLAFTSYAGRYNPWYYWFTKRINRQFMWKAINLAVPKVLPVKYKLQKFFSDRKIEFAQKVVKKILEPVDPRNIYFRALEGKLKDYPEGALWERTGNKDRFYKQIVINTFDCITPDYTNCATHEEVQEWCKDIGFSDYKIWGKGGVRAVAIR